MNKQIVRVSLVSLALGTLASVAFATPLPACSPTTARGTVCVSGTTKQTSCGNNVFIPGAVRNAGDLDDGCFNAMKNKNKKAKPKAPDKRQSH